MQRATEESSMTKSILARQTIAVVYAPTGMRMAAWKQKVAVVEEQMKWGVLFALALSFPTAFRDVAFMEESQPLELWLWALAAQLTVFMYWAFMTPAVLHVMDWIHRRDFGRLKAVGIHAGLYTVLGLVFCGFVALVNVKVWPMYGRTWRWASFLRPANIGALLLNSALKYYLVILLGGFLYSYWRAMREEELRASQLKQQLSESQFRLLRMQLHPHFLFNALHSISTLTYTQPAKADRMISLLSDMLRISLETHDVIMVPLREELQYLSKYLEIEQVRFSDRLEAHFSVEPNALSLDVPNLILQPLVENAIKHGISKQAGAGRIEVIVRKERGGLVIAVEDNGPGFAEHSMSNGLGTGNVRERLARLYNSRARLLLKNLEPHGARQELFIPIDDVSALFETPQTVECKPAS